MALTSWLVDKSALVRLADSFQSAEWASRLDRGLVRISSLTLLEVGFSARSGRELEGLRDRTPFSAMPVEYLTPAIEDRAMAVQMQLARAGHHRGPSVPDLLIAATAELVGLCVLHVDRDFDLIAQVTGQRVERLS